MLDKPNVEPLVNPLATGTQLKKAESESLFKFSDIGAVPILFSKKHDIFRVPTRLPKKASNSQTRREKLKTLLNRPIWQNQQPPSMEKVFISPIKRPLLPLLATELAANGKFSPSRESHYNTVQCLNLQTKASNKMNSPVNPTAKHVQTTESD